MVFYADLHLHSHFSRATAKSCDLEHLALWARKKGLSLLGTGDFTHPGWIAELKEKLEPAEPGVFRLVPALDAEVRRQLYATCQHTIRFVLSAEISTIYKKSGRTRKVHHVVFAPDFDSVGRMTRALARIGNLASDGRPILGLDSRDLLEIVLSAGEGCYLVPAHIWTPWFSALGSASGFDSIDECYGDLCGYLFAVETGLSSDPAMNWRISQLDRFRLISCSDAHSPQMLGREACALDTSVDYFSVRQALSTGRGYLGTVEFFPEEGKYHLDGHRKCNVRLTPEETRQRDQSCPVCGKPVTVGVMSRVETLADRPNGSAAPPTAGKVWSLVPLPEILGEIAGVGSKSKTVTECYERIIQRLGPELSILTKVPLEQIGREGSPLLEEAISRLRAGKVIRDAGYDGEYGEIRLFEKEELTRITKGAWLFENACVPAKSNRNTRSANPPLSDESVYVPVKPTVRSHEKPVGAARCGCPETGQARGPAPTNRVHALSDCLSSLDPEQRRAAEAVHGPVMILAGPGSGKTRTLTHRIAHLIEDCGVPAEQCLTITFSRRAAAELRERLEQLLANSRASVPVYTFHALGLTILQERSAAVGLQPGFRVASEQEQVQILADAMKIREKKARGVLERISQLQRTDRPYDDADLAEAVRCYRAALRARHAVDYDELIGLSVSLLQSDPSFRAAVQQRYQYISIDEFQDIDAQQYRLIQLLAPRDKNVCAIGDPDQAIYGFRGSDPAFSLRFLEDFPGAQRFSLTRNYRSSRPIVEASAQVIASQCRERPAVEAVLDSGCKIEIHQAPSELAEAEFVVQTIERLIGGHNFFSVDSGRTGDAPRLALSFGDFALLYRTDAQAEAAVEALARSGIPFQKRSHDRLRERPGVQELVDSLIQSRQPGFLRQRLQAAEQSVAVQRSQESGALGSAQLQLAVELLLPLADQCGEDVERFIAELALGSEVDTWDPRAERVSLLTLHAAKGLEFSVVFILGCEQGILPLTWPGSEPAALQEERRLFYVGMTRARDMLYLCHARKRRWRGKPRTFPRSDFLQDIEEVLVEQSAGGARKQKRDTSEQLSLF
jgi:DNA helicase-2/ATP-dependent DNA helicase PcrA